jgi:WD40 repeat protein
VESVVFSRDSKTLASASSDKTIKLWDVAGCKMKTTFRGHTSLVVSLSLSKDDKTLASASLDHTIKLWKMPAALKKGKKRSGKKR